MSTIFSFIPLVYADPPEEWDPWQKGGEPAYLFKKPGYFWWSGGNWIGGWVWLGPDGYWEMSQDAYSSFRIGWIISDYEIEMGWDPGPPYQFRLFVDGEEIVMQRWARHFKNWEVLFPNGEVHTTDSHVWMWSVRFDPNYFELGYHEIRLQMLVKKPYYGSDSKEWRFFENHLTGGVDPEYFEDWYGPAGLVWDQTHTLYVYN
jgi:hypothetical protein